MQPTPAIRRPLVLWVCLLLAAGVTAVYWPVTRHPFINYDEPDYVTANPHVQDGLTGPGIVWAFTTGQANNWHPLTWLSHMLDCQLFGLNPAAHHLANALLHLADTLLLFFALRQMTGATWRSAFVAALFGLHPLHVESVAWVAERKDVLSAFFFMLTLWAYATYVQSPSENQGLKSRVEGRRAEGGRRKAERNPAGGARPGLTGRGPRFYLLSLVFFACGLMSKPMVVTVPFVLLLLDFWPLRRVEGENRISKIRSLLFEKLPFLALSAASCAVTWAVQGRDGNIASLGVVPLGLRFENALVSYVLYLKKMLWPADLALFYPYAAAIKLPAVVAAALLLILISGLTLAWARRRPWLAVGWFWYLGTLVPVIGLVQVGSQAMADRYTYIPLIGVFLALTWGCCDLLSGWRHSRMFLATSAVAVLAMCGLRTATQLSFWQDGETLYRHTLALSPGNLQAELNLGCALSVEGKSDEAAEHFERALSIKPDYDEAQVKLGMTLAAKGNFAGAIELYRSALATRPRVAQTHWLLGSALNAQGNRQAAIPEYERALELDPDHVPALNDLALLRASVADPNLRNGAEAVRLAERLCRLTDFQVAQLLGTLAAAYAEAGRFDDAAKTAAQARDLAKRMGQEELAGRNEQLLELYRAGKPYHENALSAKPAN